MEDKNELTSAEKTYFISLVPVALITIANYALMFHISEDTHVGLAFASIGWMILISIINKNKWTERTARANKIVFIVSVMLNFLCRVIESLIITWR